MCRLVAYVGRALPLDRLVFGGSHTLERQAWAPRELLSGSVNADGYGVVWYPADEGGERPAGPVRIAHAEPIWYDPDLRALLESACAPVALAALRNTTPGLPVDRAGLLPMLHDEWAFVLNGWVPDFRAHHMRALRSELSDELYADLLGVSDSETLFLLTLSAIAAGADPFEALASVVDRVARRLGAGERAPLTLVLAARDGVWALNTRVGEGPCNSLYLAEGAELAPGGTLLASEPLDDDPAWRPVPAHGRVRIEAG